MIKFMLQIVQEPEFSLLLFFNLIEYTLKKSCFFTDLAVYEARSRNLLPHWLKLKFLQQDDHCDAMYAQIGAIDSFSHCVHLFLGPACDYCVGMLL